MIVYQDKQENIFSSKAYNDSNLSALTLDCKVPEYLIEADDLVVGAPGDLSLAQLDKDLKQYGLTSTLNDITSKPISQILSEDRDCFQSVLGLYLKHIDNKETKCGGKVIKNVSGYDMAKLYLGSCNSLAIISYAYLRLIKLPEYQIHSKIDLEPSFDLSSIINLHEDLDLSLDRNILSLQLNSNASLVELRHHKLETKLKKIFGPEATTTVSPFNKDYATEKLNVKIKASLTSLLTLYPKLCKTITDRNIILNQKKLEITIYTDEVPQDELKYLAQTHRFYVQVSPVNQKNKIIERQLNNQNNDEIKIIQKLKKLYDPHHKLNPGILNA